MERSSHQVCVPNASVHGRYQAVGKKVSPLHHGVNSKSVLDVYNRYYREPVSALYRAVKEAR